VRPLRSEYPCVICTAPREGFQDLLTWVRCHEQTSGVYHSIARLDYFGSMEFAVCASVMTYPKACLILRGLTGNKLVADGCYVNGKGPHL